MNDLKIRENLQMVKAKAPGMVNACWAFDKVVLAPAWSPRRSRS
jgi:hypothetical protein